MLIGFNFEMVVGSGKLVMFWIATVFGGNIFGALCTSKYAVGSDMYVFALIGGMIGITLVMLCRPVNVSEDQQERVKCSKICVTISLVFLLVLVILMMSSTAANMASYCKAASLSCPDIYGSIGGFMFGLILSLGMVPGTPQAAML
jgi:membrane associated rhomboid family serine protease